MGGGGGGVREARETALSRVLNAAGFSRLSWFSGSIALCPAKLGRAPRWTLVYNGDEVPVVRV